MTQAGERAPHDFPRPVRIAVISKSAIMRHGCAALIERADHLAIVAEGAPENPDVLRDVAFDIAVVGITARSGHGADAIRELAAKGHCVLAVTGAAVSRSTALDLGAHGVFDGVTPADSALVDAIDELIASDERPHTEGSPREIAQISPREREVLEQLARGRTDREIADALGISVRTVQSHLDRIREKTRRRRRAELTMLAVELGLGPSGNR